MPVAQLLHDVQNQLSLILECADHLAWSMPPSPAREGAGELHRCAERALAITRELLATDARRVPAPHDVDVKRIVVSAMQALTRLMGERVRLRLRFAEEPALVRAETRQIERIVLNLVLNARDAMAGEGALTISTDLVHTPEPHVQLTVMDTGVGMTPEVRERVFEPYFTTKNGSIGLGLSAVKLTVSHLRGTVAVETEVRRGTSVAVLLPLASPR